MWTSISMPPNPCQVCGTIGGHSWTDTDCLNVPAHDHRRASVGFLCPACVDRIVDHLADILILYATLPFVTPIGSVHEDVAPHRHVKNDSAPAPMRLSAVALLDSRNPATGNYAADVPDVAGVIGGWAECLCDRRGLAGASLNGTLTASVHLLREHAPYAAAAPWVDEFQVEVEWVWRSLRDAHGLTPPEARPIGRCPSLDGDGFMCGGDLWADRAGAMQVACGRCKRIFGETYLRHLGGMLA